MTHTTNPTDRASEVHEQGTPHYSFVMGLIAGGVAGLGLGMLLAPRSVLDLRKQAADSARTLGGAAADRCQQAGTRAGEVVDAIARKGQGLRDDLADAVVRGAQEVERVATSAKSSH